MMQFKWPIIASGAKGWTALDARADGALLAVSVRRGAGGRPTVIKCAHSSAGLALSEALTELAHQVGVVGFPWTLALQRGEYQMLVLAEPAVLASEMEHSLRWTMGNLIDYPVDEAHLTWMKIPTAELQPNHARHLYAVVARHALIKTQQVLFQKCKLNLRAIDVRETAQRNVAALIEKKGEGLGLLRVAPDGVSISFTFAGELYLDRFIEQPLAEVLAADETGRQEIFERIALQVSRSIDFISRNFPFMPVQRMVLAPLPAPIGLRDYLAGNLSLPVEQLDLATLFDLSLTPELTASENQSRYFIALGAALRGMGNPP